MNISTKTKNILQIMAVTLLVIVAFVSSIRQYIHSKALPTADPNVLDGITEWENRLIEIKYALPEHGQVGYISEWDIPGWEGNSDLETEYRLTQYSLAPLVIARGVNSDIIVGNIAAVDIDEELAEDLQVSIVDIFGYGFYALSPKTKN